MLRDQHAAPGLADDMIGAGDPEHLQQVRELVEEQLDGPEIDALVGQVGRAAAAQLVVVDDGASALREPFEPLRIVVPTAGTAMQDDDRPLCPVEAPGDPVPGAMAAKIGKSFRNAI